MKNEQIKGITSKAIEHLSAIAWNSQQTARLLFEQGALSNNSIPSAAQRILNDLETLTLTNRCAKPPKLRAFWHSEVSQRWRRDSKLQ